MQEEIYVIRKLPNDFIIEPTSEKCDGEHVFYNLKGTFPGRFGSYYEFKIRPKAADFVKLKEFKDVYVVLHIKEEITKCIFLCDFHHSNYCEGIAINLCRCLGKTRVKRHYDAVKAMIEEKAEFFEELSVEGHVQFTVFHHH